MAGVTQGLCADDMRAQLETATTAALGYHQTVTVKDMPALIMRGSVAWQRQWPYGTQYHSIAIGAPRHAEHCQAAAACLTSAQGPTHTQRWVGDMALIMGASERGKGESCIREFEVTAWDDATLKRLHIDIRREYVNVMPRVGSYGARTEDGASTA